MPAVRVDVELAVAHDVEAVPDSPARITSSPADTEHRDEVGCDALLRCERERCEHRHAIDELPLGAGAAARSISTSRRYVMSVRSGRIDPTTRNADRGPIAVDDAGAAIEPMATPPIASPQISPSTRVNISSGMIRWRSVNPATSSMLLAAPTIASKISIAAR